MQYISIKDLSKELNLDINLGYEQILRTLSEKKPEDLETLKPFFLIQNAKTKVFNSWIEQHNSLKELLIYGKTSAYYIDIYNWKQHSLFNEFKAYLSLLIDFLFHRKEEVKINSEWSMIFSYFELLVDEKRFAIEKTLFENIWKSNNLLFTKCSNTEDASEFNTLIFNILTDDCIQIHNYLSRSSYSIKISFVEQVVKLFFHSQCTIEMANWLINKLEKFNLNFEQKKSIEVAKDKLYTGEYIFKKTVKRVFSFKHYILLILPIIFIAYLMYYLYNIEGVTDYKNFKEASSLTFFSVNERKEIDSLLKSTLPDSSDSLRQNFYTNGNSIIIQNPIKNNLADSIYSELEQDMNYQFLGIYDTCIPISRNKLFDEEIQLTKSFEAIQSNYELEVKNDSEYSILILAWMEKKNDMVYSKIVPFKSNEKIKIIQGMKIILLPGIKYGAIPLIFKKDYKYLSNHFCSIDFNYEYLLQKINTVNKIQSKQSRLLIEGFIGEVLNITDAEGILN